MSRPMEKKTKICTVSNKIRSQGYRSQKVLRLLGKNFHSRKRSRAAFMWFSSARECPFKKNPSFLHFYCPQRNVSFFSFQVFFMGVTTFCGHLFSFLRFNNTRINSCLRINSVSLVLILRIFMNVGGKKHQNYGDQCV